MSKVLITGAKWTLEEVFDSKELLGLFISKVETSPRTFPETKGLLNNIERAIALGGKGYARKPTQFPLKVANEVLKKYNVNNNFFDFSCGWGIRLLSAMKNEINYYGTDPNYLLIDKLKELKRDYTKKYPIQSTVELYCQGSEKYLPELKNKIGLAFSSPPYYNLENYNIGEQSYHDDISYEQWKETYLYPTFKNIKEYLIPEGKIVLNIKNVNGFNLVQDSIEHLNFLGFELIDSFPLKNIKRMKSTGVLTDREEFLYVFKRRELADGTV